MHDDFVSLSCIVHTYNFFSFYEKQPFLKKKEPNCYETTCTTVINSTHPQPTCSQFDTKKGWERQNEFIDPLLSLAPLQYYDLLRTPKIRGALFSKIFCNRLHQFTGLWDTVSGINLSKKLFQNCFIFYAPILDVKMVDVSIFQSVIGHKQTGLIILVYLNIKDR